MHGKEEKIGGRPDDEVVLMILSPNEHVRVR